MKTLFCSIAILLSCLWLAAEVTWEGHLQKNVVLVNQIGYERLFPKKAVVEMPAAPEPVAFQVIDHQGKVVFNGQLEKIGPVAHWGDAYYWRADFSTLQRNGLYRVLVPGKGREMLSAQFAVGEQLLGQQCLSDILFYFKAQRCSGVYDQTDRSIPFFGGRPDRVDVHGGWFDASGDFSKYLSHLSYANFMNPQQAPMVVWNFLQARELLQKSADARCQSLIPRLEGEALHGADFLVRMQDQAGYFYLCVFDQWSHDPAQRQICSYRTQEGEHMPTYQAALREGGGMSIAALARISTLGQAGDYAPAQYLAAAERGYSHLSQHNREYDDDGRENIIDDYCGLLAATELYQATSKDEYLGQARQRAEALIGRLSCDDKWQNWWRADERGERSYFHAVEAGLPLVALWRYRAVEPDKARKQYATQAMALSLEFELAVTGEVANPFGYPRQYVSAAGKKRTAFFIPHENESGYWWQGEDARLASLAAAALLVSKDATTAQHQRLVAYALNALDWVLGLNPFAVCMLQGKGWNNTDYLPDFPNAPGGICNGITAGFAAEDGIAFLPEKYAFDPNNNWRWSEQWLPHGSWFFLALSALLDVLPQR